MYETRENKTISSMTSTTFSPNWAFYKTILVLRRDFWLIPAQEQYKLRWRSIANGCCVAGCRSAKYPISFGRLTKQPKTCRFAKHSKTYRRLSAPSLWDPCSYLEVESNHSRR